MSMNVCCTPVVLFNVMNSEIIMFCRAWSCEREGTWTKTQKRQVFPKLVALIINITEIMWWVYVLNCIFVKLKYFSLFLEPEVTKGKEKAEPKKG